MEYVSVDDIFKIRSVAAPKVMGKTGRVTYLVGQTDQDKDTYYSYLHAYDSKGNIQLTYKDEKISEVNHSNDGMMTAFTAKDEEGKSQVFLLRHAGGEREQITNEKDGASSPIFGLDDQTIYYSVKSSKEEQEKDDKTLKPTVVNRMKYKSDGGPSPYGVFPEKYSAIKKIDIHSKESETVLSGDENYTLEEIAPNGFFYSTDQSDNPDYNFSSKLYYRKDGQDHLLREGVNVVKVELSPDHKYLLMTLIGREYKNATHPHIEVLNLENETTIDVTTALDKPVGGLVAQDTQQNSVNNPSKWISNDTFVFIVSEFGSVNLYRGKVDGSIEPLYRGKHNIFGMDADDTAAYLTISTHVSPSELYKFDFASGQVSQLTEINKDYVEDTHLVEPEEIEFTSFDETTVHGWFMKPAAYKHGNSYPMITNIHGGPHALFANTFFHEMQVLAAKGYAVLFINPRGSHSYSQDFVDAVRGDYGNGDYKDIMAAVDYVTEKFDWIDQDKLGVTGGSYGGFMTNWIVGHTNRFKAAVTQRSISNWISFRGVSDIGYYFTDWQILADLDDLDKLWHHSPLKYAANVETPLLILHGEEDIRCPIEQGEQLFIELKSRGKETQFVRFPKSSHELSRSGKPSLRMERLNHMTNWFEKYI
ncbi:S9 family peptidase [Jeotgalicoccus meleagridis]|uniref:Prolyl tripeptidyl peptidase n=1 Tax=Jeotgalicoccus meleagridis TaxID=2759181 RepID=A0A6V7RB56_9STAP|nr:S9 family peptidase [Jeotgalicoccus meleagridis]CAD2074194.1 Prolyl tripeptidyl peptidase precursor [Jeotgalicoccus meleagridis]